MGIYDRNDVSWSGNCNSKPGRQHKPRKRCRALNCTIFDNLGRGRIESPHLACSSLLSIRMLSRVGTQNLRTYVRESAFTIFFLAPPHIVCIQSKKTNVNMASMLLMCVCVCVCIYMYIYMCVCMCVFVCGKHSNIAGRSQAC